MKRKTQDQTGLVNLGATDHEIARTLSIVQQMAQGKRLHLPNGQKIGMGEDMSIGFVITKANGVAHIGGLSTMDICQLNRLLNEHNIGMAILE